MYDVNTTPLLEANITRKNNKEHIDTNDNYQFLQTLN